MKKVSFIVSEVIKWAAVAAALVFILSQLSSGRESASSMEQVAESVLKVTDLSNMKEADNQMIRRLYGLNPDEYEAIVLYYPTTNMGAEELLIVKLKEMNQKDAVVKAIEKRRSVQMKSFDGYGVDQYDMLEHSVIQPAGNFILYISSRSNGAVVSAFQASL